VTAATVTCASPSVENEQRIGQATRAIKKLLDH